MAIFPVAFTMMRHDYSPHPDQGAGGGGGAGWKILHDVLNRRSAAPDLFAPDELDADGRLAPRISAQRLGRGPHYAQLCSAMREMSNKPCDARETADGRAYQLLPSLMQITISANVSTLGAPWSR